MTERVVKVRLVAAVSDYEKGMMEAARATRTVGTEAEKLQQSKEAFNQVGQGLVITGAAITAVTALSIKAAMDWQSAWAGVTKTVEGTPEELARVEDGLRGLTSVLPASHDEIAAVAEAAGQLGIETPNVVAFTRTMIDLGETTNLSANDAATALARFTNIMGTSQDQVDNLGSAIVGLGNNYATTESEILDMSMRLAGAGKQIGLTEGDVLGLATALSSVGIEAEAGGSAMSKVMIDIAASVEEGGARLDMFAQAAGMSAQDFANQWRSEPSEALAAFVRGLAAAETQGGSTLGILAELGITEVRMRDALLRSASAAGMFSEAMAEGNVAFDENVALALEAAKRYETVESKVAIAGNAVRDAAIDFGEVFLPAVGSAAEAVTGFAAFMGDLPDPVQGVIGVLSGAVGVIALTGGSALLAIPKIVEFKIAMETLGISMRKFALIGGGALLALTALVTVVGAVSSAQAEAQARAESYADTLAEGTNKVTDATRAMAKDALAAKDAFLWMQQDSAFDAAEKLGISLDLVTDAAMGNVEALEELQRQIDAGADGSLAYANSAVDIENAVRGEADSIERAIEMAKQKQSADADSAESSQTAADAYLEQADAVDDLSGQLSKLIDRINEANGVNQDAVSANARYQEALAGISEEVQRQRDEYERANETLDGFTLSLDESTAAGATNAASLAGVAAAAQNSAAKQYDLDKATMGAKEATDKYAGTLAAQRQAFIDAATGAGYNADEVQKLADKVFALPSEKEIDILAETAAAQNSVEAFIRRNADRRFNIYIDAVNSGGGGGRAMSSNADGGFYDYQSFSDGGFPTGIYKGGTPIHKFAEPETVWESYISGKPSQRERNVGLWVETGRRLGVEPPAAAGSAGLSVDGATISGTLMIGGDGLAQIIDGRIRPAIQGTMQAAGGRR